MSKRELTKEEADEILSEARHKELMKSFGSLLSALTKEEKQDTKIPDALEKQAKAIQGFVDAIKSLPKPEKPEVNVSVSNKEIVSSVEDLNKSLVEVLKENTLELRKYNERKLPESFETVRDRNGYTLLIKINYKK
jgi:hypothetical protein